MVKYEAGGRGLPEVEPGDLGQTGSLARRFSRASAARQLLPRQDRRTARSL